MIFFLLYLRSITLSTDAVPEWSMPSNHLDDACQSRGDSAAKCAHTNSKGDECTHKINDNQFFSLLSSKILLYLHNKWMHSYRYGPSIISFVVVLFFFFVRILLICDTNDICLELWSAKWESTEARRVYTFFILNTEYNHTPQSTHVKFIKNEVVNFPNLYPNDVS